MLPREKSGQFEGKIWWYHTKMTAVSFSTMLKIGCRVVCRELQYHAEIESTSPDTLQFNLNTKPWVCNCQKGCIQIVISCNLEPIFVCWIFFFWLLIAQVAYWAQKWYIEFQKLLTTNISCVHLFALDIDNGWNIFSSYIFANAHQAGHHWLIQTTIWATKVRSKNLKIRTLRIAY